MVGGKVIEVIDCGDRIWVNCQDTTYTDKCAIYVKPTTESVKISIGDSIWWQGRLAFWTRYNDQGRFAGPEDVKIPRIGYSGIHRPQHAGMVEKGERDA